MRFPIPPDRVDARGRGAAGARAISRASSCRTSARRVAQGRGSELAALFDAQILMLDDPMLVGRAEEIIRTERVNAAWAVHRAYEELVRSSSRRWRTRTCASARTTSPTSPAACA